MDNKEEFAPYGIKWLKEMNKMPKSVILKLFKDLGLEMEIIRDSFSKLNSSYSLLLSKHKILESQQEELIKAFAKQLEVDDYKNPELDLLVRKARLRDFKFEFYIYDKDEDQDDASS